MHFRIFVFCQIVQTHCWTWWKNEVSFDSSLSR